MPRMIEISDDAFVDPEAVRGFGVMFGDHFFTSETENAVVDINRDQIVEGGIGVIATEAGLHQIAADHLIGFVRGGKGPKMSIAAPGQPPLTELSTFNAEANSLVFQDGGVITIPRSAKA